MNPSDLDALAERSGLRLPPLRRTNAAVLVVALMIGVVLALGLLAVLAVRLGGISDVRFTRIQKAAPRLCAQRWPDSHVLFISSGDLSASIACGSTNDRVVAGHIEVAYP